MSHLDTRALERFQDFMVERERVRIRKESGLPRPWTDDPILHEFKFTNVHRSDDRTTRWLVLNYYHAPACGDGLRYMSARAANLEPATALMNCALYRYFGTTEFAEACGWRSSWPHDVDLVVKIAERRLATKQRVFTGAYVVTNMGRKEPKEQVVGDFLRHLWRAAPGLVATAHNTQSWEAVGRQMTAVYGFGGSGFMTKEVLLDTMFTRFWPHPSGPVDRDTWTPVGPGARRGLNRLFGRTVNRSLPFNRALAECRLLHTHVATAWPSEIEGARVQTLGLHDVQFQLCEYDKYERVRLGEGRLRSKYRS